MSGRLFAFRVAKPVEASGGAPLEGDYDPESQTTVWKGEDRPLGATCTPFTICGTNRCRTFGGRCCQRSGGYGCGNVRPKYACDDCFFRCGC